MYLCFLSPHYFDHEYMVILFKKRTKLKALNSPHMFNCKVFMGNENCFSTRGLNVSCAFDFSVRGKI